MVEGRKQFQVLRHREMWWKNEGSIRIFGIEGLPVWKIVSALRKTFFGITDENSQMEVF